MFEDFGQIHLAFVTEQALILKLVVSLPNLLIANSRFNFLAQGNVVAVEILFGFLELLQLQENVLCCKLAFISCFLIRDSAFSNVNLVFLL